jgi:hypothetical protein
MKILQAAFIAGALLMAPRFSAAEDKHDMHAMPAKKGSDALEKLKGLAGSWEGDGGPMGKITVEYRVTGGGSAVEERLAAGTPHEMVTMYYDQGGTAQLTHYCSLGNRPAMKLKSATADKLDFDFVDGSVASANEPYMHSLTLSTPDATHLVANWHMYEGGKEKAVHTFNLTRKKA